MFILQIVLVDGRLDRLRHFARTDHRTQGFAGMRLARDAGVKRLHGGMEDRTEHRGIDLLGDLVVGLEAGHGVEIEAQGAGHVAEKSRRRERGRRFWASAKRSSRTHHPFVLGHLDRRRLGEVDVHPHLDLAHVGKPLS